MGTYAACQALDQTDTSADRERCVASEQDTCGERSQRGCNPVAAELPAHQASSAEAAYTGPGSTVGSIPCMAGEASAAAVAVAAVAVAAAVVAVAAVAVAVAAVAVAAAAVEPAAVAVVAAVAGPAGSSHPRTVAPVAPDRER